MERVSRSEAPVVTEEERGERQFAALGYLWIFSLIILAAKRHNAFIQHHARRATVLFILSLLIWWIPYIWYGEFLILALAIFGFIQAAMGRENQTPILSELADGTLKRQDFQLYIQKVLRAQAEKEVPEAPTAPPSGIPPTPEVPITPAAPVDEEKLSALFHRVAEDENEIHRLEHEVRELENQVESLGKESPQ